MRSPERADPEALEGIARQHADLLDDASELASTRVRRRSRRPEVAVSLLVAQGASPPIGVALGIAVDALRAITLERERPIGVGDDTPATADTLCVGFDGSVRIASGPEAPARGWSERDEVRVVGCILRELLGRGASLPRRSLVEGLDREETRSLDVMCACACAEAPDDRYPSARHFLDDLEREFGGRLAPLEEVAAWVRAFASGASTESPEDVGSSPYLPVLARVPAALHFDQDAPRRVENDPSELVTRRWSIVEVEPPPPRSSSWAHLVAAVAVGVVLGLGIVALTNR